MGCTLCERSDGLMIAGCTVEELREAPAFMGTEIPGASFFVGLACHVAGCDSKEHVFLPSVQDLRAWHSLLRR